MRAAFFLLLLSVCRASGEDFPRPEIKFQKSPSTPAAVKTGVYVYDSAAHYVVFVPDGLPNEVLFLPALSAELIRKRKEKLGESSDAAVGAQARLLAIARYTVKTAAQLKAFHTAASKKPGADKNAFAEPGGVLWIDPATKELQAWNCEPCARGRNTFSPLYMFDSGWDSPFIGKVGGEIFALWHGHPGSSYESGQPTDLYPQWGQDLFGNANISMNDLFAKHFTDSAVAFVVNAEVGTVFALNSKYSREKPFLSVFAKSMPGGVSVTPDGKVPQYGSFFHKNIALKTLW